MPSFPSIALAMLPVIQSILLWVQNLGPIGAIAFVGLYSLAAVCFVPGSLLTLGAGIVYGLVGGSILVFVAATIGAILAFLVGRYLARDWVARKIVGNAMFSAIDQAVAREGLKIVTLMRLSPVVPFNLLNYAFGVTQVSLKDYTLGSIGMIPGTVMYVYIGSLLGDLTRLGTATDTPPEAQTVQWILRIVGLIATISVTIYITKIAQKALQEQIK